MNLSQNICKTNKSEITGCLKLIPNVFRDKRGLFGVLFHTKRYVLFLKSQAICEHLIALGVLIYQIIKVYG